MTLELGQNIVIIGQTCSGKSTLGEELAEHLGKRSVELDALWWEPGWTNPPIEVFRKRVDEATEGDSWVVAGNYSAVRANELLWGTNRERFWDHFTTWSDESLIAFAIKNHRSRRKRFEAEMAGSNWPDVRFRRLRSPKTVERFRRATGLPGRSTGRHRQE